MTVADFFHIDLHVSYKIVTLSYRFALDQCSFLKIHVHCSVQYNKYITGSNLCVLPVRIDMEHKGHY